MHFNNKSGYGAGGFSTCMTSSMLWNFPDADSVDIGNGSKSEFHGSVLVSGDLTLSTTGQSGRTMVLGDIIHDGGGSEFHSYEFKPPIPLPDPDDICVFTGDGGSIDGSGGGGGGASGGAQEAPRTKSPSKQPTQAPKIEGCKAIPQSRLPQGSWATSDSSCKLCKPPNNVSYYPCDKNPPLCEGNCAFSF